MVFNPLGPGLELVWDIIAFFISFFMVLMVVQINGAIEKSGKLSSDVTRKIVHIFAAPVFVVSWILFSGGVFSRYIAMIVPLMFVLLFAAIGTGKMINEAFVGSMSRSGDPRELLGGTLYYALMLVVTTVVWFYVPVTGIAGATPTALIIWGCVAGGDGLADVIGRKYGGERKFGIGGSERTLIGSVAMFIGSFLFSFVLLFIFSLEVPTFDMVALLVPLLIISLAATLVEALSPKGLDNWTVPITVIAVVLILSFAVPLMWSYPLFTL